MTRPFPVDQRDHARTWAIVGWFVAFVFAVTTMIALSPVGCRLAYGETCNIETPQDIEE